MNIEAPEELSRLTSEYQCRAGKYYQMFAGTYSSLLGYDGRRINLEIRMPEGQWEKWGPYLTMRIAESWRSGPEFKEATRYRAEVYVTRRPAGFAVAPGRCNREQLIKYIVQRCREAEKPAVDVLNTVIEEDFAAGGTGGASRAEAT